MFWMRAPHAAVQAPSGRIQEGRGESVDGGFLGGRRRLWETAPSALSRGGGLFLTTSLRRIERCSLGNLSHFTVILSHFIPSPLRWTMPIFWRVPLSFYTDAILEEMAGETAKRLVPKIVARQAKRSLSGTHGQSQGEKADRRLSPLLQLGIAEQRLDNRIVVGYISNRICCQNRVAEVDMFNFSQTISEV